MYICCVNITLKQTVDSAPTNLKYNFPKTLQFPGWSLAPPEVASPGKGKREKWKEENSVFQKSHNLRN